MIDEFPAFAAAAAFARGKTTVMDAQELRHKESDRITALCTGLQQLGINAIETADGFEVEGSPPGPQKNFDSKIPVFLNPQGDHRLAMCFTLLGLAGQTPVRVNHAEIIAESFPDFVAILQNFGAHVTWEPV
jgi:3-phosphoshikimate 1-carboxyvinyltransferase